MGVYGFHERSQQRAGHLAHPGFDEGLYSCKVQVEAHKIVLSTLPKEHVGLDHQLGALHPWVGIQELHKVGVSSNLAIYTFLFWMRASDLTVAVSQLRISARNSICANGVYGSRGLYCSSILK